MQKVRENQQDNSPLRSGHSGRAVTIVEDDDFIDDDEDELPTEPEEREGHTSIMPMKRVSLPNASGISMGSRFFAAFTISHTTRPAYGDNGRGQGMRIIAACVLAFLATRAVAENLVMDDARIQYSYTYETLGTRHFCDFATTMSKAPLVIKLTAATITDDAKPKDHDLTVAYIVEGFVIGRTDKNSPLAPQQVKVVAGRIISNIFDSDLHASKNADKDLGASYTIPSESSLALFMNLLTIQGAYTLDVEFGNHSNLIVNVRPTPEIFGASEKWNKCSIAISKHRPPP